MSVSDKDERTVVILASNPEYGASPVYGQALWEAISLTNKRIIIPGMFTSAKDALDALAKHVRTKEERYENQKKNLMDPEVYAKRKAREKELKELRRADRKKSKEV